MIFRQNLREAVNSGNSAEVSRLLAKAHPRDVKFALRETDFQWSLLMKAASDGNVDIVNQLLKAEAPVDDQIGGITPLMAACMLAPQHIAADVASTLLEAKADPNVVDKYRETCLMKASARGCVDLIHVLIKAGAKVNANDNNEHAALYHAAKGGHAAAVRSLLQAGADEQAKKDALAIAETKELKAIIEILAPDSSESEEELLVSLPERYAFAKKVLAELPSGNGRVGFPSDVPLLLSGVGQGQYAATLLAAGFGIAQLISANDKELRDAGVRFALQRRKIMEGMLRMASHSWSSVCLPKENTITSAVHAVCCAVRHVHVMWATTLLGRNRADLDLESEPDMNFSFTPKAIAVTAAVIREAEEIRRRAAIVAKLAERKMWADPVAPADLLRQCV